MCRSRGGIGGPDPPGKSQVIWVSIEISIWTTPGKSWTPLENVGPPLDLWKSIVFSVIKPLDPLCRLLNELRTKKKSCSGCFLAVGPGTP